MKSIEQFGWVGTGAPDFSWDIAIGLVIVGMALASCAVTYLVFYLVQRFVFKKPKLNWKLLAAALVVGLMIFPGYYYASTAHHEWDWKNVQERCASEVGYSSSADDNNPDIASWQSQTAYRECTSRERGRDWRL